MDFQKQEKISKKISGHPEHLADFNYVVYLELLNIN